MTKTTGMFNTSPLSRPLALAVLPILTLGSGTTLAQDAELEALKQQLEQLKKTSG